MLISNRDIIDVFLYLKQLGLPRTRDIRKPSALQTILSLSPETIRTLREKLNLAHIIDTVSEREFYRYFPDNLRLTSGLSAGKTPDDKFSLVQRLQLIAALEIQLLDWREIDHQAELIANARVMQHCGKRITFHAPFLWFGEDPTLWNFSMRWLVIPQDITPLPVRPEAVTLEQAKKVIDVAIACHAEVITFHVTRAGYQPLNDQDFNQLKERLKTLVPYANQQSRGATGYTNGSIKLCIETGGVTGAQLLELSLECGTHITFDTAHAYIDGKLLEAKSSHDPLIDWVQFYKDHHTLIPTVHLVQCSPYPSTGSPFDSHCQLSANDRSIPDKQMQAFLAAIVESEQKPVITLESPPHIPDYALIAQYLNL